MTIITRTNSLCDILSKPSASCGVNTSGLQLGLRSPRVTPPSLAGHTGVRPRRGTQCRLCPAQACPPAAHTHTWDQASDAQARLCRPAFSVRRVNDGARLVVAVVMEHNLLAFLGNGAIPEHKVLVDQPRRRGAASHSTAIGTGGWGTAHAGGQANFDMLQGRQPSSLRYAARQAAKPTWMRCKAGGQAHFDTQ